MLGLMLFGMPLLAFAEDVGLSKQYSTCMDKAGGITANMLGCIGAETQRQDARLNRAYKDVMAQLSAARKKQLQEAQRAWIRYRRLSDLGIVGCKLSAAAHFSPSFCPIARLLGCKSGKNCARWGQFSLSTPQVRQPPSLTVSQPKSCVQTQAARTARHRLNQGCCDAQPQTGDR